MRFLNYMNEELVKYVEKFESISKNKKFKVANIEDITAEEVLNSFPWLNKAVGEVRTIRMKKNEVIFDDPYLYDSTVNDVVLRGPNDGLVRNCNLSNCKFYHISCQNSNIEKSKIESCEVSSNSIVNDCEVVSATFHKSNISKCKIDAFNGTGSTFKNSKINFNGYCREMTFEKCTIYNTSKKDRFDGSTVYDIDVRKSKFINCNFTDTKILAEEFRFEDCEFINCKFKDKTLYKFDNCTGI